MQFLKILFWAILAVVLAAFARANWGAVTIRLWADIVMDIKLPVLLVIAVLVGFLPTYALLRTERWRSKRRIASMERNAEQMGLTNGAVADESPTPVPATPILD
ncbi:DUF1049 domain-containing protein [Sphingomonas crocodyli]|uniref:DUF1049 domain-containing protein n=1 Tax=Sphingomonas crocodyli TaxID=1979270 RepID=A0A437LVS1_9SPHN|nr:DUF1049 domain-containing protein [Sphingomonas crocodyli]RVT89478.1 DUF1049 domain-containing protein [Sphingomonas crocodyli]